MVLNYSATHDSLSTFFHSSGSSSGSSLDEEETSIRPVGEPYNNDAMTPVFSWQATPFTWQKIVQILSSKYEDERLCVATPLNVQHNVSFLVNNNALKESQDIKCDDMGVWHNKGSPNLYFKAEKDDGEIKSLVRIDSKPEDSHNDVFVLKRTFYVNASSPDCRKVISVLRGTHVVLAFSSRA